MNKKLFGILLVLFSAVLWAHIGILARFLYSLNIDPLSAVTARSLLAAIITTIILAILKPEKLKLSFKQLLVGLFYGTIAIGANFLLYFYALKFTQISVAVTLIYTNPIFIIFLSAYLLREKLQKRHIMIAVIVFLGVWLLVGAPTAIVDRESFIGPLFALGCAFCIGIYNVVGKRLLASFSAWTLLTYALWGGSFMLGIVWLASNNVKPVFSPFGWLCVFALAIGPTILGYGLYLKAVDILGPTIASILAASEPVFATVLAWMWFGERITVVQSLGILCIILSAWAIQYGYKKATFS